MDLPVYIYFIIPCILASIPVYFQQAVPLYLKLLPALLVMNLIAEVLGFWIAKQYETNVTFYNFYTAFELTFFLFTMREIIVNYKLRKVVWYLVWIYPLFACINIFLLQKPGNWHSVSYGVGNLLIVGLSIYYFFELFKRPKAINLIKEPGFWISAALLFFYSCSFPIFGLVNFIANVPSVIARNLSSIITVLNILLYVLLTIAFLCRYKFAK